MTSAPEPWQLKIPFAKLAERSVGPVLAGYAFVPSVLQPNLIKYSNGEVRVDLAHHPRDGEIAVDFGREGTDERYSFLLYLRSVAPQDAAARQDGVSWTSDEVERTLGLFANALRNYAEPILRGDPEVFDRVKSLRWWHGHGVGS